MVGGCNNWLLLRDEAGVTIFVQFFQERRQVPGVKVSIECLFELRHGRVFSKLYVVVEMEQESSSQMVGDNNFGFGITRHVY